MGLGRWLKWLSTNYISMRARVWIPETCVNAGWVWQAACNSGLRRWRQNPQSELASETTHISEFWVCLRDLFQWVRWKRNEEWFCPPAILAHTCTPPLPCVTTHEKACIHTQAQHIHDTWGGERASSDLHMCPCIQVCTHNLRYRLFDYQYVPLV